MALPPNVSLALPLAYPRVGTLLLEVAFYDVYFQGPQAPGRTGRRCSPLPGRGGRDFHEAAEVQACFLVFPHPA